MPDSFFCVFADYNHIIFSYICESFENHNGYAQ